MHALKRLALAASVAGMLLAATAANADEMLGDGLDDEPVCPYGYYDFAPYACAPYGYYGPEWFVGGLFIGTGPWLRAGSAGTQTVAADAETELRPKHLLHGQ
jgi:hypothetical protein